MDGWIVQQMFYIRILLKQALFEKIKEKQRLALVFQLFFIALHLRMYLLHRDIYISEASLKSSGDAV